MSNNATNGQPHVLHKGQRLTAHINLNPWLLYTKSRDRNGIAGGLIGYKSNRNSLADHEISCGKKSAWKYHRIENYNHGNGDVLESELSIQFSRHYSKAQSSVSRATRGTDY